MRILVTGGCGLIGSHICDALAEHDVLALDNLSHGKRENVQCNIAQVDITDVELLEHVFSQFQPEIVIHTAAQVQLRESLQNPVFDAQQNIIGTITVLEACRKFGVKKIIYTSTGGARYGEPEKLPVPETAPVNPLSPYGISKHTAEHYIQMYHLVHGIDYLILCFGNVYGPRDDIKSQRVMSVFMDAMINGRQPKIFGDGKQTRDFLYVKDIARLIARNLTTKTEHKLINLASGEGTSVNQLYELIEHELQSGIKPQYMPAVKGEVRDIVLDITLAREELGFVPTPIVQGIKETLAWQKQILI
jgi:UDP-glucose 4-epimerase